MEINVTVERAFDLIRQTVKPVACETLPVLKAHNRVLAEAVTATIEQPPFPRSPLDGYAFHAEDSFRASHSEPVALQVVGTLYAGSRPIRSVRCGEAVRIMTGAPIPDGCNCVIRQEETECAGETVVICQPLKPWSNYCFAGEDYHCGDVLLPAGTRLTAKAMGVLASSGLYRGNYMVQTYCRPRFAVISTGSELLPSSRDPLPPGKIYSSNDVLISIWLEERGAFVLPESGLCDDRSASIVAKLQDVVQSADAVITTGGVSVGERDLLPALLPGIGAEIILKGVLMKPGSPLMLSIINGVPVLSLSGNPFAAYTTLELFGRQMMAALTSASDLEPHAVPAVLGTDFEKASKGRRFIRGLYQDGVVMPGSSHSSGQLASVIGTNCLVDIPAGSGPLKMGDHVKIVLL